MALAQQVKILVDGNEIGDYLDLNLQQNVFGHHSLEIVCRREDASEAQNGIILDKSDKFLGGKISLTIKISDKEKVEFDGIITEIRASKMNDAQSDTIVLEASSLDIILDDGEHCRSFQDKTLKAITDEILKEYAFTTNKKVKPEKSKGSMAYTVQYKESAFAFLTRMASKKGEWFYYDGKDIIFGARNAKEIELEFGTDIFNFDYSLKIDDLKFKYLSYDYLKSEVFESDSGKQKVENLSKKAKVAYKKSEDKYKHETLSLYNHSLKAGNEQKHLDTRVKLIKSALASGFISCSGSTDNASLKLGGEIKIVDKYDESGDKKKVPVDHGTYIITSLSHTCDRTGNYQNNFTGVPKEIEVPPFSSPHAIPFCETQSATVMDNDDSEKLGRIQVQFLWQKPDNQMSPWLRILTPHSGKDQGFSFIPEIDDEVLVAFEGGNAEKPYVIGSFYHGKAKPDSAWLNDKNDIKAIRTRSGHTIEFSDKDGSEELKIYDYNKDNYVITLASHSSKITIESKGDLEMKAEGKIDIKATGDMKLEAQNIEIKSGQEFKTSAMNAKAEASAQMELKASAGMKLDGGAQMEQKAGLIRIN